MIEEQEPPESSSDGVSDISKTQQYFTKCDYSRYAFYNANQKIIQMITMEKYRNINSQMNSINVTISKSIKNYFDWSRHSKIVML